jgi:hypothetical protein
MIVGNKDAWQGRCPLIFSSDGRSLLSETTVVSNSSTYQASIHEPDHARQNLEREEDTKKRY